MSGATRRHRGAVIAFVAVSVAITAAVTVISAWRPPGTSARGLDYWTHAAAIREWSTDLAGPGHPHLPIEEASPRYAPSLLPAAVAVRWFGIDAIAGMAVAAATGMAVLLAAIFAFFRTYLRDERAPLIGLALLVGGWGLAYPWSGLIQARSLLSTAAYPATAGFGLALLTLAALFHQLRREAAPAWHVAITAGTALTLATHRMTAAFLLVAAAVAVLTSGSPRRRMLTVSAAVAAGAVAVELWPYFSFWQATFGEAAGTREAPVINQFREIGRVLVMLGPLALGMVAVWRLARTDRHRFVVLGFVATMLPFLIDYFAEFPRGHRFILFAAFFLAVALTVAAVEAVDTRPRPTWLTAGSVVLAVALVWNAGLAAAEPAGYLLLPFEVRQWDTSGAALVDPMRDLAGSLPDEAVVMAPSITSWAVPAFGGKTVTIHKPSGLVGDEADRAADTARFFSSLASGAEREEMAARWGVTHVLWADSDVGRSAGDGLRAAGRDLRRAGAFNLVLWGAAAVPAPPTTTSVN